MSKRNLLNLGLLALIAALALVIYFEPGKEKPPEPTRLLSIEKKEVARIRIERHDRQEVLLDRRDGRWWMTQPVTAPVSDYRADAVLRLTEAKSLGQFSATEHDPSLYGLDQPRVRLALNDKIVLAFGNNTPLDNRRYVMHENRIHLITDTVYYQLIGDYTTFLDSRLLPPDSRITSLTLPTITLTLVDGRWQVSPQPEDYSADRVTELNDAWTHASAVEVKAYDGNTGEKVDLQLQDQDDPIQFLITAKTPDLILARPDLGIQYHLAEHSAKELLELANEGKAPATETAD